MRPPERWTRRLRNFAIGVAATIAMLGILAVAAPVTVIARAVRWAKSREADGCLFGVMLIVLAIVLAALLLSVIIAGSGARRIGAEPVLVLEHQHAPQFWTLEPTLPTTAERRTQQHTKRKEPSRWQQNQLSTR